MSKRLDRVRHFARNLNLLRQQLGWRQLWKIATAKNLAPVVIDPAEVNSPQKVLVLAPHPDDEVFGCGGALVNHYQHGDSIHVIYICSGSGGRSETSDSPELATKRKAEALKGLELIGATSEFWGQADGRLQPTVELITRTNTVLAKFQPTRIYTPWLADNHPDHMATTALLIKALEQNRTKAEVWQYEIWSPLIPNRYLPIKSLLAIKKQLIACHQSQLEQRSYEQGILGLNDYRGMQADLDGPAEAFFALPSEQFAQLRWK